MATPEGPSQLAILKAVTFRIHSTPVEQLPQCIPYLTGSLASCRQLLSSETKSNSKKASEADVALNRLRTQLSTLLQDRSIQGRWAAIVLVKCVISLGGWEVLQKCKPWVQNLLGTLSKPDPPTTKKLAIITLTRIFYLSKEYPTLVREVTTPSLTPFVTSCMSLVFPKTLSLVEQHTSSQRALLATVLEAFNTLLPRHPTIFRPFLTQINLLLSQCIAPTSPTKKALVPTLDAETVDAAQRLFVLLHFSAPKDKGPEEWFQSYDSTIKAAHSVADRVFRSIIEAWQSTTGRQNSVTVASFSEDIRETGGGLLKSPPWHGIYAGGERLVGLLGLLRHFVTTNTTAPVDFRIGLLADLLSRILSLAVPYGRSANWGDGIQYNPQIGKDERNALFTLLPGIHIAAMEVLLSLVARFKSACLPFAHVSLEEVIGIFDAEKDVPLIRGAAYLATTALLDIAGRSLTKQTVTSLSSIVRPACLDLLPQAEKPSATAGLEKGHTNSTTKQNNGAANHSSTAQTSFPGLESAASNLLSAYLSTIHTSLMPVKVRSEIERIAVLLDNKDILLASILNPRALQKKVTASLLPLAARLRPDDPALEGLLRPRMPAIRHYVGTDLLEDEEVYDDDGDEMEVEEEPEETEQVEDGEKTGSEARDDNNEKTDQAMVSEDSYATSETKTSDPSPGLVDVTDSTTAKRPAATPLEQSFVVKRTRVEAPPVPVDEAPVTENETLPSQPVTVVAPVSSVTAVPVVSTTAESSDSDDEDYGELVIGPDTDDEAI
ncbi:hypothetical protein EJ05DRAFT_539969 [Pseudovirgaria hyperparasitica]|uniref:Pre-rRNA-processing protein RIX1 n=1 Tax=Pseudovirgaria hyperparasitica TaxID=470096 RepID=A0A6A6W0Z1_9PEZI|nr:uncharacterized protein EJ05DRAFT_539969 [Pseudovirgaria hyperparasitica]KAF2756185.1 hypothetical protein EJ05DRAFT_539969 [Pseudovirgaria hyperparasitica]